MRRRAGVEVLVGGGGRLVRDAEGWQRRVEGTGVEDIGGVGGGHHRLLRLERWASPQNAGTRGTERHGPGMHHALPRIVARGPRRGLGVGGVAAGVGGRVAAAVVPVATTIRAVVGAGVPAAVAVAGSVVGALGGRGGGPVLGTGGDRAGGAAGVVAVGRGEGLPSLGVGVVLEAELLKDEEAAGALEGVRRELGGDHWLDVAVPGVEAAEKI